MRWTIKHKDFDSASFLWLHPCTALPACRRSRQSPAADYCDIASIKIMSSPIPSECSLWLVQSKGRKLYHPFPTVLPLPMLPAHTISDKIKCWVKTTKRIPVVSSSIPSLIINLDWKCIFFKKPYHLLQHHYRPAVIQWDPCKNERRTSLELKQTAARRDPPCSRRYLHSGFTCG